MDSMDNTANNTLDDHIDIPKSKPHLVMKLWMEFDSDEEAYMYYNDYAGAIGFSIRKEYVNKNKTHGYVTFRKFTCYKEGHREQDKRNAMVKKPRNKTRTGCLAHIIITRQLNGKFCVTGFEKKYNHPLTTPLVAHMLPSQRKILEVQAHELNLADDSGIRPKPAYEYAVRQAGDRANLGYTSRDLKNYLRDKRKNDLRYGEAVYLDDDGLITNVFWADAKMIMDYHVFGDVLSFDTTYRTDRNYRPFGLFVGMNNHKKMVVFSACLLYEERIESFKWIFKKFIEVMSGRTPKTFIMDQDPVMSKAISLVMPETYHQLCVWHLEKNACKHLNHVFRAHESFHSDFSKLVYHYEVEEEFLTAWDDMLEKYELKDNEWLKTTFSLRHKWCMTYGRNTFSASMRSTQLSESFNGSLRGYLKFDLDLVQFFKHFLRAVDDKRFNESLLVIINSCEKDKSFCKYNVHTHGSTEEHTIITKPYEIMVSCSCKLFEYLGILCRHSLKILDLMNIKMAIPSHYILKRWTKDATVAQRIDINEANNEYDPFLEVTKHYRVLCPTFNQLSVEASDSKEGYELAVKYANKLRRKLKECKERARCKGQVASSINYS